MCPEHLLVPNPDDPMIADSWPMGNWVGLSWSQLGSITWQISRTRPLSFVVSISIKTRVLIDFSWPPHPTWAEGIRAIFFPRHRQQQHPEVRCKKSEDDAGSRSSAGALREAKDWLLQPDKQRDPGRGANIWSVAAAADKLFMLFDWVMRVWEACVHTAESLCNTDHLGEWPLSDNDQCQAGWPASARL